MNRHQPSNSDTLSRRRIKQRLRELLLARDLEGIVTSASDDSRVVRYLPTMLFDPEPLVCWRAIESLGQVAAMIAEGDLERVRVLVRSQVWQMNDESGNVGWYAAEAIGEMLYNVPPLIDEYGPLLLSFLHEEPFERGAHWAVARVASVRPDIYRERIDELLPSLEDEDAYIRAFAWLALVRIDRQKAERYSPRLADETAVFSYYDFKGGLLREVSLVEFIEPEEGADGFPPARE